jgi:cytochrome c553
MLANRFSAIFGAVIISALAAAPARADDIEAQMQVCGACHGQNGEPQDKATPIIWGQQQSFLVKQLHDYKAGDRDNPVMSPLAKGIKQEELRKVAAYFAGKSWPTGHGGAAAASQPGGMAVCSACHQPNFAGSMAGPRLAGQSYEFLIAAMRSFADGSRTNNLDMPRLMRELTDSQRDAMARYLSAL